MTTTVETRWDAHEIDPIAAWCAGRTSVAERRVQHVVGLASTATSNARFPLATRSFRIAPAVTDRRPLGLGPPRDMAVVAMHQRVDDNLSHGCQWVVEPVYRPEVRHDARAARFRRTVRISSGTTSGIEPVTVALSINLSGPPRSAGKLRS